MLSNPTGTLHANARLDETEKGFVPVFGGSHRLSRLPFELGLYFALTGEYLDHDRMARIGLLNGMLDPDVENKQYRKRLTEANLFFRSRLPYNTFD